jgi:plasmid maintenance system antidote protein VapI
MQKDASKDPLDIHLAEWLEFFQVGPSEAARIAGCSQGYISNIMAGRKKDINVLYLLKLSDHFGITVNDFYRPLPSKAQLNTLKSLSPRAQASILARQQNRG